MDVRLLKEVKNISDSETVNCAYDSEMFRRRLLIKKTCKQNRDMFEEDDMDTYKIFAMMTQRLVWCPEYKSASANWMKNIPRLSHYTSEQIERLSWKKKNRQANTLALTYLDSLCLNSYSLREAIKSHNRLNLVR